MKLDLGLLLAHADHGRPVLAEGLAPESTVGLEAPGDPRPEGRMRHDGADPNALSLQRWGVVAPEGAEGDRLLALVDPLIRARSDAQAGRPVRIDRVPPGMSAAEVRAWRSRVRRGTTPEDQPRYLLVLGDMHQVSLDLQQVLAGDAFVGRLAFRREADYVAYAEKVLRWERSPPREGPTRALFFTALDGTYATALGHRALMDPTRAQCVTQRALGTFGAAEIEPILGAPRSALLDRAAESGPAVLLSMCHGLGAPMDGWASAEHQRALQGAMCLGEGRQVFAEELAARPFLPGGVWFFLACFSAGTPTRSAYFPWLRRLREMGALQQPIERVLASLPKEGDRAFIAALPQAALANPEGPLAIIGHVDLAWTYSFQDPGPQGFSHPSRFYAILRALFDGCTAGVAHAEITRFLMETVEEIAAYEDDEAQTEAWDKVVPAEPDRDIRKAHLWMRRHDLAGYLLLGDPAVRLPLSRERA